MDRTILTTRPLKELQAELAAGVVSAAELHAAAAAAAAENKSCRMMPGPALRDSGPWTGGLSGLPLTVKDLLDVAGAPTTCGADFFAAEHGVPAADAPYVARWRRAGAAVMGKTSLHEFAYGITGENRAFGDCTIPGHPDRLTGGSSSGAAASVLSGAACLALGTDTGGSLRVPAALCGLVSFRQSLGFGEMEGAFPLAPAFDTLGWIQRHLGDVAWVAACVHPEVPPARFYGPPRIASLMGEGALGAEPEVLAGQRRLEAALADAGAVVDQVDAQGWGEALEIFTPIQAADAAAVHSRFLPRFRSHYDPAILARLEMGAALDRTELTRLRARRAAFVARSVAPLFLPWDFLVAPASALTSLQKGADHAPNRPKLLGLTTPASLAGLPALTVSLRPGEPSGLGYQFLAARGGDNRLWALADWMAQRLAFPI